MIGYIFEPELHNMLENFYTITGIRVGIHDPAMNILMEHPEKSGNYECLRFCDKVRYHSNELTKKCLSCDIAAFNHMLATKKKYIYRCHMGLLEALIPVKLGDEIVCALMIGQVQPQKNNTLYNKFLPYIKRAPLDEDGLSDLHDTFDSIIKMDENKFIALTYFLEMCAQSIYDNRYIRRSELSVIEAFCEFVNKNLYNIITINQTAQVLKVSTSHLSRLIASELNTTFTKYLSHKRMEAAKNLLTSTDMKIKDIAAILCYSEPNYFMKKFKGELGVSCSDYRRQNGR